MSQKYYTPSGRIPLTGWLIFMIGGLFSAWVLSFIYILITTSINFLYANALVTLAFGGILGLILVFLVRIGHLRSPVKVGMWGFVLGLATVWIQWVFFYAYYHYKYDDPHSLAAIYCVAVTSPEKVFGLMKYLLEHGHFGLRHSNAPINDYPLLAIWIVEAVMLIIPAVIFPMKESRKPFSECSHRWAAQDRLPVTAAVFADVESGKAALEQGNFSVLNPGTPGESYMNVDIYAVNDDDGCHFLSLEFVEVKAEKNKKGVKRTTVLDFLKINPEVEKELRERFSLKSDSDTLVNAAEEEGKPLSGMES